MKRFLLFFAASAISTLSFAQTKPLATTAPLFKTSSDSASYAFGASIANDLKSRGVTTLNYSLISKAMNDVLSGGAVIMSPEKCQQVIFAYLSAIEKKKFEGSITTAANFLAESFAESSIIVAVVVFVKRHVSLMFEVSEVSIAFIICLNLGKPVSVTFFSAIPL